MHKSPFQVGPSVNPLEQDEGINGHDDVAVMETSLGKNTRTCDLNFNLKGTTVLNFLSMDVWRTPLCKGSCEEKEVVRRKM